MKKIIFITLSLMSVMIVTQIIAVTSPNFVLKEETINVNGKKYDVKYAVIDGKSGGVEIDYVLAFQHLFKRDEPEKIAQFSKAVAALNGPYHNESGGWSNYLFDCTYARDGKVVRIFNSGSNFCVTKNGQWLFGSPRFSVQGTVQENLLPQSLKTVYVSGVNQPPTSNSTTLYTDDWGDKTPNNYSSTCVVIQNSVVSNVQVGPINIPSGAYVLVYTGKNRERCDAKRWPKGYIKKGLHINIYWKAESGNTVDLNKWRDCKVIFGGAPTVVKDGKNYWNLSADKFTNYEALSYDAERAAFGLGDGKVYLVTFKTAIKAQEEGPILLKLGVKNAFNLDGGCSTFLYFDGKTINDNCRPLPSVIIARPKQK